MARSRPSQRSLTAHLSNLHLLLRSPYFSTWPLKVRFFSADVRRVWDLWCQRVDGGLPSNIVISDGIAASSVQQIKTDYGEIQSYLEKATFLLDDPEDLRCKVCQAQILPMAELVVVCPQMNCHCIAHLLCLSEKFLSAEESDKFVPTQGICPACKEIVQWPLMMQELTLRCRGEKELQSILRKKRRNDNKRPDGNSVDKDTKSIDSMLDEINPVTRHLPTAESGTSYAAGKQPPDQDPRGDSPLDENWLDTLDFGSDSEVGDRLAPKPKQLPPRTEIVIEDSDEG